MLQTGRNTCASYTEPSSSLNIRVQPKCYVRRNELNRKFPNTSDDYKPDILNQMYL